MDPLCTAPMCCEPRPGASLWRGVLATATQWVSDTPVLVQFTECVCGCPPTPLCASDASRRSVGLVDGAFEGIANAMRRHGTVANVQADACSAISALAQDNGGWHNSLRVMQARHGVTCARDHRFCCPARSLSCVFQMPTGVGSGV